VSALTIKMVEMSKAVNSAPVTGNVPADAGAIFFFARFPAMQVWDMHEEAASIMATAPLVLYHMVLPFRPPKAEPLLPTSSIA